MTTDKSVSPPQHSAKKNSAPEPVQTTEQPFTVRFGRLLAGQGMDEPINDPANPNLIISRRD